MKPNEVLEWIKSKPWDKKDRLRKVIDSIVCEEKFSKKLKLSLIKNFLKGTYCSIYQNDYRHKNLLIFEGAQGLGKTSFLRSLVGANWGGNKLWFGEGLEVDILCKDSLISSLNYWICEMVDFSKLMKSYPLHLRAFLKRPKYKVRLPYQKKETILQKNTQFVATTNEKMQGIKGLDFFVVIPVVEFKDISKIDMQQVWAQVAHLVGGKL